MSTSYPLRQPPARRILNGVALGVLLLGWAAVNNSFTGLPDTIPIHFNITGTPDGYAPKAALWRVTTTAILLFSILVTVQHIKPDWYNYPFPLQPAARPRIYEMTRMFVATLNVTIATMLAAVEGAVISASHALPTGSFMTILWVMLALTVLLVAGFIVWLTRFRMKV